MEQPRRAVASAGVGQIVGPKPQNPYLARCQVCHVFSETEKKGEISVAESSMTRKKTSLCLTGDDPFSNFETRRAGHMAFINEQRSGPGCRGGSMPGTNSSGVATASPWRSNILGDAKVSEFAHISGSTGVALRNRTESARFGSCPCPSVLAVPNETGARRPTCHRRVHRAPSRDVMTQLRHCVLLAESH